MIRGDQTERTALMILGAAVWSGGRPSPTLARRALHAAELWRGGVGQEIVPCGGIGRHPPSEAEAMRRLLVEAGIPDSTIHPETRSTSTAENVEFALPILNALGISAVVIVSDAWHLPRAALIARRKGLEVSTSAPPWRTARLSPQIKGAVREIPAYLAALCRPGR